MLVKPAHQLEQAQRILPKLQLPNLALQVLKSYATAARSRRTTLLDLAERYADKLNMQAMPEGGYCVRFLDLLQLDWTLENLWSPIVPFCHRMKFEVEYMPKDYISAISKLYKQFKDPSLETSERTSILSKIFDICLQAAGPAREMQESFESDPETTGRLHERRTTIDQEPDVPNVEKSPKKPSGKENKPQNRKTDMAPPKTIPKKAKKSKPYQDNTDDSRKSVKRTTQSDNRYDAKRSRIDDSDNNTSKAGLKGGSTIQDKVEPAVATSEVQKRNDKQLVSTEKDVGSEINGQKKISGKTTTKTVKETAKVIVRPESDAAKKGDSNIIQSKTSSNTEVVGIQNTNENKDDGSKNSSEVRSKITKKRVEKNNDKNVNSKDSKTGNAGRSEKETENTEKTQNDKTVNKNIVKQKEKAVIERDNLNPKKDTENSTNVKPTVKNTVKSKDKNKENNTLSSTNSETTTTTKNDSKKVVSSKNDDNIGSSKRVTKNSENAEDVTSKIKNTLNGVGISKRATYTKDDNTQENVSNKKNMNNKETVSRAISKSAASPAKDKPVPRNIKDNEENGVPKKVTKNADKDTNLEGAAGKTGSEKTKTNVLKKSKGNATKPNDVKNGEINNKDVTKGNNDKNTKISSEVSESRVVKEKQAESAKITTKDNTDKENCQAGEKRKNNPKTTEQKTGQDNNKMTVNKTFTKTIRNDEQSEKTDDVVAKKSKTTEPVTKNVKNNNEQPKKSTADTENSKNNPNATVNTRILKEKPNRNETLQKAVGNNRIIQNNTNKTNQKINNMPNVIKSKILPISKLTEEKQIKIADKLKTKIPMMKNKMKFSSLSNKLGMNNAGKNSNAEEKIKISQKSLPVFKKVAKNLPTRHSPRKLPTFKPASKGFSNK
ncbi:GATA zinc finger domain-containing protein 14-like isoform X2 [Cydia pomonella]|uniref:GATA zinc finger domain-containing protein 14-like isoform X2 n=1 Tax=Cydia pomonella TaxID=82600 RepID=UPI002ADE7DB2|nr:GATA zinc finger domain-containing protein 14-like isoform X2 [Cydia pomonella]